jgi:hypothetical protein
MRAIHAEARSTDLRRRAPTEKRDTPAIAGTSFGIGPLLFLVFGAGLKYGPAH